MSNIHLSIFLSVMAYGDMSVRAFMQLCQLKNSNIQLEFVLSY